MQSTVCHSFQQTHHSNQQTTSRFQGSLTLGASKITPLEVVVTSRHLSWLLISEPMLKLCSRIQKILSSHGTLMVISSLLPGMFCSLQLKSYSYLITSGIQKGKEMIITGKEKSNVFDGYPSEFNFHTKTSARIKDNYM